VACATGSAANTVVARAITPAAGREGTTFTTHTAHGHTYVVPDDARGLLASGRVDRRLFDVTTLLDHGYRDGAPLIVTGRTPRSGRALPAVGGVAATVVATAGETTVRTPVGVVREYETHTLTINYLDENGEPTPNSGSYITSYTHDYRNELSDEDGTVEIDLRAGRYLLDHQVFRTGEDEHVHAIVQPNLELTADTTITVDARTTKPLDITPPAGVSPQLADIGYTVRTPSARYVSGLVGGDPSMVSTAHLGAPPPAGDRLIARVNTQWDGPNDSFYGLTWYQHDTMFTGLTKVVRQRELATVHVDIVAQGADRTAERLRYPEVEGDAGGWAVLKTFPLPTRRTEYLTTQGLEWGSDTRQLTGDFPEVTYFSEQRAYRAGRTHTERVGDGMFGPALPNNGDNRWATRIGDALNINVPLFGDANGNGGFAYTTSAGGIKVYSDGELIGESPDYIGYIPVPEEERDYRVTVTATRGEPFDLATTVSAEWTFSSAYAPPLDPAPLAVSVLRFDPKLDNADRNRGPAPPSRRRDNRVAAGFRR
jgi:hypothetical protein